MDFPISALPVSSYNHLEIKCLSTGLFLADFTAYRCVFHLFKLSMLIYLLIVGFLAHP